MFPLAVIEKVAKLKFIRSILIFLAMVVISVSTYAAGIDGGVCEGESAIEEVALSFLEESLTPTIFWAATSAIGTFLAILVALLSPIYFKFIRNNHIERVLQAEIVGNLESIKHISLKGITSEHDPSSKEGVSAIQRNNALVTHVELSMWSQFKYELAANRPKSFKRFKCVNDSVELLLYSKTAEESLRLIQQNSAAKKFMSKYNELFDK